MIALVRPVREDDIDALMTLAAAAGKGFTTLPTHRPALVGRIEASIAAFSRGARPETVHGRSPGGETVYLVVLEDVETRVVHGVAGVYVDVGRASPFWNFRRSIHTHFSREAGVRVDSAVLTLANDYTGATAVGSLFLAPGARIGGNGALLARSRYLLMANAPDAFGDLIIAEMRGWLDDAGESPFWKAVGRHFFQMSFDRADRLSGLGESDFIGDLMPRFPIYADILPEPARKAIGKPQDASLPAFHMLLKEGFRLGHSVDIFDAGPVLEVHRRALAAIGDSHRRTIRAVVADAAAGLTRAIACTLGVNADYRCVPARFALVDHDRVDLSQTAARSLGLAGGDSLRLLALKEASA